MPWFGIAHPKGRSGIPKDDLPFLHALLNAGMPGLYDVDEQQKKNGRILADLHRRVGMLEMTNHEFMDEGRRKQRTTFSDGTTVTVELDSDQYEIRTSDTVIKGNAVK